MAHTTAFGFIYSLLLSCVVSAFQPPTAIQFIGVPSIDKHPLCDLGCKCPGKGQSFSLLDCSQRYIKQLPTSLQFDSSKLTSLNFQNNHIAALSMSTFSKVDHIEELDLSENEIMKIENFTLQPFMSLALLRLSHNHLSEITPGLLEGLKNLRILEIGYNSIQRIKASAFQSTPLLQELRMQYNPVFELPENMLQYLPNLQKLDLQDTGLVRLPSEIFKPTPHLQWLSLSNNAFETVPEEALSEAEMLESLDLSGNDFTFFVQGDFRRLSKISILYLNNLPKLERIEKDALAGLQNLKAFYCSFNPKLMFIDQEAFGSKNSTVSNYRTPPREQLYLRQNALRKSIEEDITGANKLTAWTEGCENYGVRIGRKTLKSPLEKEQWSALSYVDLADNPWKCDCNIVWMTVLSQETRMNIVCDNPPHLRGRPLGTIPAADLKCEFNWELANFVLIISCISAIGIILVAVSVSVCSRTPVGLYIRAKKQFSYAKVTPKSETLDLEWDPSADI